MVWSERPAGHAALYNNYPVFTELYKAGRFVWPPRASGDERKADRLKESVKKATLFELTT